MRAADGDRIAEAHQLGQHLGAAHHRQMFFARGDKLGIGAFDRGGDDNHFGIAQIFGLVADGDGNALFAQALQQQSVEPDETLN